MLLVVQTPFPQFKGECSEIGILRAYGVNFGDFYFKPFNNPTKGVMETEHPNVADNVSHLIVNTAHTLFLSHFAVLFSSPTKLVSFAGNVTTTLCTP
jgi:hypothetical protein